MNGTEQRQRERLDLARSDWRAVVERTFAGSTIGDTRWTEIPEIARVLNMLGSRELASTIFFPDKDFGHLANASERGADGSIEIYAKNTQTGGTRVVRPTVLAFHKIDDGLTWSYFWMESEVGPFVVFPGASPYSQRYWSQNAQDAFAHEDSLPRHMQMDSTAFEAHIRAEARREN